MCSKTLFFFCVLQIIKYSYGQPEQHFFRYDYTYLAASEGFYKIYTMPTSWVEAKRICAREGAFLFFPDTKNETDAVLAYLKESNNLRSIHVGLSDLLAEGVFETVDGKGIFELPHKWLPGEPNNRGDGEDEDCVEMNVDGRINDLSCTRELRSFICKRALATLQWNRPCNMAFMDYRYNATLGRCYKFHRTPVNWQEAHAVCAGEQSYLAVINSLQEADYLVQLTEYEHRNKTGDYVRGTVFLGFHNKFGDGWTTVKGTSLEDSGYECWAPGQPDGGDRDKCGSMFYSGLLNDIACDKKSFFICEHRIVTPIPYILSTTASALDDDILY